MKNFLVYILLLLPFVTFGQLFPKVADFKGNIEKVVKPDYLVVFIIQNSILAGNILTCLIRIRNF